MTSVAAPRYNIIFEEPDFSSRSTRASRTTTGTSRASSRGVNSSFFIVALTENRTKEVKKKYKIIFLIFFFFLRLEYVLLI